MAILTWSNQLELGVPSVDKQHQHLVEILNQLDEAVALGYEPQKVLKLVDELIDYTHYHFEDEERFMLEG
ncbi:MAG: hemerythrin domain-containing protein, partial [Methylomonas lenta]|nr:hemerythrin domain-containing protein [Methylomonas lenta]